MITLIVAVLALVVALAGVVLSAIALGRSGEATDPATKANNKALPAAPDKPLTEPTTTPTGAEADDQANEPGPTSSPTDISPRAQFTIAYEGEHLRARSVSCDSGSNTYVDLDEPRVIGREVANTEFGYQGCDPGKVNTSRPFAEISGPTATPKDCLETIRTDPGRSPIAPKSGMTLCIVTDQNAAAAQGISQKLVFVTIDAVSANNNVGVLNMTVKAWTVPQ
jgi:hypothetical protein